MRALLAILTLTTTVAHARAHRDRIVIDVDLKRNIVSVFKFRGRVKTPTGIAGYAVPVTPGSIKPGVYRPLAGRVKNLDNAIFFGKSRTLRTSPQYAELIAGKRPVAGSVVLSPDFGGIVFAALARGDQARSIIRVH